MIDTRPHTDPLPIGTWLAAKLRDYAQLAKLRLSLTVVFSAGLGYLIAFQGTFEPGTFLALLAGGFLITAAANATNELLEVEQDSVMSRTRNRPLPAGRMQRAEAITFAALAVVAATLLFFLGTTPLTATIGLVSYVLYAFLYTPLKRVGPIAVFVGAIPGALPPAIGAVAATGELTMLAALLFILQFFWQFPHFWAIAWLGHEDYAKAGYHLLPSNLHPSRLNAAHLFSYTLMLVLASLLPMAYGFAQPLAGYLLAGLGLGFLVLAGGLFLRLSRPWALRVFLFSLAYLPIAMVLLWLLRTG